jgi:glutathione peroxidase
MTLLYGVRALSVRGLNRSMARARTPALIREPTMPARAASNPASSLVSAFAAAIAATFMGTIAFVTGVACSQSAPQTPELTARWKDATMHDIKVKTLDGKDANLSEYAGKVVLVVNVASQCGFTRQYKGLQKIHDTYKDRGFVVLGFPSGDFGGQEFDSASEIREFCSTNYSVTFPLFEKCVVKAGKEQSPVFEALGTKTGVLPGWNFGKYLVSRDGKTAKFYASNVSPDGAELIAAIEKALGEATPAAASSTGSAGDTPATPAGASEPAKK